MSIGKRNLIMRIHSHLLFCFFCQMFLVWFVCWLLCVYQKVNCFRSAPLSIRYLKNLSDLFFLRHGKSCYKQKTEIRQQSLRYLAIFQPRGHFRFYKHMAQIERNQQRFHSCSICFSCECSYMWLYLSSLPKCLPASDKMIASCRQWFSFYIRSLTDHV